MRKRRRKEERGEGERRTGHCPRNTTGWFTCLTEETTAGGAEFTSHRKELSKACGRVEIFRNLFHQSVRKHCAKPTVKIQLSECGPKGAATSPTAREEKQSQRPEKSLLWRQLLMPQAFPLGRGALCILSCEPMR